MKILSMPIAAWALALLLFSPWAQAAPIDFEQFTDSYAVSTEVPGVAFSGGTVLTAGVGLNDIDFPPVSGQNVLAALTGVLTITTDAPVDQLSAYFTYASTLNFSGYDSALNLLFSVDTPSISNLGSHYLFTTTQADLSSLVISAQGGTAFTLDDLQIGIAAVPEPGVLALVLLGALGAAISRRRQP